MVGPAYALNLNPKPTIGLLMVGGVCCSCHICHICDICDIICDICDRPADGGWRLLLVAGPPPT